MISMYQYASIVAHASVGILQTGRATVKLLSSKAKYLKVPKLPY